MYERLEHKLGRIERALRKIKDVRAALACTCRARERKIPVTHYHTTQELKKILWVRCPVHGLRDPGFIMWTASRWPLNKEDWEFCTCPPHIWRDSLMWKGRLPTQQEIDEHTISHNLEVERRRMEPKEVSEKRRMDEHDATDAVINEFYEAFNAARGLNAR
jgi:hypothetical protein